MEHSIDMENVIYDIERCICHVPDACRDCSHYGHGEAIGCMEELLKDALALLKEQEAKTPVECEHDGYWYYTCPTCGNHEELFREWNYCPFCGQAVKWE